MNTEAEKNWEEEHWISQKREDADLKPETCPYCRGSLFESVKGWMCNDCHMQIDAVSYYHGANGKAKMMKKGAKR